MTIIDIEDFRNKKSDPKTSRMHSPEGSSEFIRDQLRRFSMKKENGKNRILTSLATRCLFLLLLAADLLWGIYSVALFIIKLALNVVTAFSLPALRGSLNHSWLCIKRSIIGFIGLFLALFSPALGIMFACIYFLMYDKNGVEEMVPNALKEQFKDFFPS